jgi:ankyrin repeat protein
MDLYEACEQGNEERVVELLLLAFKIDITGQSTPFFSFRRARSTLASLLLRLASQTTDFELDDGAAPALSSHKDSIVTSIADSINRGHSLSPHELIQSRGTAGRTALHAACLGGQANVVRLLLGETCDVYFTSRTKEQTTNLLIPLIKTLRLEDANLGTSANMKKDLLQVQMAAKDGGTDLVPLVNLRLSSDMTIPSQDLVEGFKHLDDFGNTPLQCISCFGCGSTEKHIEDGLEITKQLLLHGDHPNLPKHTIKWTPLHWSAYNGNVDQTALLLDPVKWILNHHQVEDDKETLMIRFDKTQYSIPLVVNNDNLFPVDIAGRRGLMFLSEMNILKAKDILLLQDHEKWRLRLDHQRVIELFVQEFLTNASQIYRYVNEMNLRVPFVITSTTTTTTTKFKSPNKAIACMRRFCLGDVIRYGQHLLYWVGCYGLIEQVQKLLDIHFETQEEEYQRLYPLYPCSCEENKMQSVLHAVCAHGRPEIVQLLLERVAINQRLELIFHHHRIDPIATASGAVGEPNRRSREEQQELNKQKSTTKKRPNNSNSIMPIVEEIEDKKHMEKQVLNIDSKKIEVEPLISQGWCNYRNETPLFL